MTTKTDQAQPAGQDGTTIVLEAEALAQSQEANEQTSQTLEGAAPATVPLPAAAAAEAEQVASTTPRMPAVAPAASEPTLVPSHMLPGGSAEDPGATTQLPIPEAGAAATPEPTEDVIADEVDPDWAVADQPTVQFTPSALPSKTDRPAFLETGEQAIWPPRPGPASTPVVPTERPSVPTSQIASPAPVQPAEAPARPYSATRPRTLGQVQPNPIPRPITRPNTYGGRLPSPSGKPPLGSTAAAYSDPRMRRLLELRLQRDAHRDGQRGPADNMPVGQLVRQWWSDLLPGLAQALDHMHEARASGVYPIPAHEPSSAGRLGDAFGRLGRAARDLGGRAQAAAAPTFNRLHDRAEHAAHALVDRIEGPPERQQAPLLGPGRVAVFFEQGVSVVQAQRLLVSSRARPMRLIPRRHGFLALVQPGQEPSVGEQLRQHPFVRDVVYLEYGDNGDQLPQR